MATTTTESQSDPGKKIQERYTIQQFKATNAKKVPYEQLDFTIYKGSSNSVVFHTREARLSKWIKAMSLGYKHGLENEDIPKKCSWGESNDPADNKKCEKLHC